MTDQVQRCLVIFRFVQLNCVCYKLWTYHHKCLLSLCQLCKVLSLWQMHKGQLLQIIPLMNTMIINLTNASLAINIYIQWAAIMYFLPACFVFFKFGLPYVLYCNKEYCREWCLIAPIPAARFERKDIL